MKSPAAPEILAQAFLDARSFNRFADRPVSPETLQQLYDLAKWGPTAMNSQPARFVFVTSSEAKARLARSLSPGNVEKTLAAPVTVIVAQDTAFYEHLPTQFPAYDAKPMFEANPAMAASTIHPPVAASRRSSTCDSTPRAGNTSNDRPSSAWPPSRLVAAWP